MEAAGWNPLAYSRSRSNSPVSDHHIYDLSYMDLDTATLEIELRNNKKNNQYTIKALVLTNNLLDSIPPSLFSFRHIETLDLSSNQFKSLSLDLDAFPHLRVFIAKNNLLSDSSLPKGFARNNHLQVVNFSGNQFKQFPYQLLELRTVQEIYLGCNQIEVLPRNYENLTKLEILYLGGNDIKKIPDELAQLKGLTSLNLSDNSLTILPAKLANLKKLRTLALHGNKLTTLPVELVKINLEEISLRNNPLVHRFAKEFTYEVPSLLELSARCIKTNRIRFSEDYLPSHLAKYLSSATCCLNPKCGGVYFTSKVEHVKFVDFCGRYRIPLMQYLCSSKCNEKISNGTGLLPDTSSSSDEDSKDDDNSKLLKKILLG